MASTRYAKVGADPDDAPERYLASGRLRGISIGLNVICRVARVLPAAERDAMIWLHNYARLRDLTADALSDELDLDTTEIRRALTDPEADRAHFVRQVSALRVRFEALLDSYRAPMTPSPMRLSPFFDEALNLIADTKVRRKVANAVRMTVRSPQIVELIGKTRIGKSIAARREYLRLLHCAAWLHCPRPANERDFICALASALGVSVGGNEKNWHVLPKIEACFGINRIRLLFIDEGHRLWPADWRNEPKRIEYVRDLFERFGVSTVVIATPQYSEAASAAMQSARWAPGQWIGRAMPFDLPDRLPKEDFSSIAQHHAPDASDDVIEQLVSHAMKSEGYVGAMVRVIQRAQFRVDYGKLTVAEVKSAQRQIDREERLRILAAIKADQQSGRPKHRRGAPIALPEVQHAA